MIDYGSSHEMELAALRARVVSVFSEDVYVVPVCSLAREYANAYSPVSNPEGL